MLLDNINSKGEANSLILHSDVSMPLDILNSDGGADNLNSSGGANSSTSLLYDTGTVKNLN